MVKLHDPVRLERALGDGNLIVRTRLLRRLFGLPPRERARLLEAAARWWRPLLLGTLWAQEAGRSVDAASVKTVAVETLALALGGRDRQRREAARRALVHGNVSLEPAVPLLERWSRDPRRIVREAVGDVVRGWVPEALIPTADVAWVERHLADPALESLGVQAAAVLVRRLVAGILQAGARRRGVDKPWFLSSALGQLPALIAQVTRALGSTKVHVRADAARALGATQPTDVSGRMRALVRNLGDRESHVSDAATFALGRMGPAIPLREEALRSRLRHKLPHVRANALRCLPYAWGTLAARWEAFTRALADPEALVRIAAARTLVGFRELPETMVAILLRCARGGSPMLLRVAAAHALGHRPGTRDLALAMLKGGLGARTAEVRKEAARALQCFDEHLDADTLARIAACLASGRRAARRPRRSG
jgi:hypothetical protein